MRRVVGKILMGAGIILLFGMMTELKEDASQQQYEVYILTKIIESLTAAAFIACGWKMNRRKNEGD